MKNEGGKTGWPNWLLSEDASISASLDRIVAIHENLRKLAEKPYIHRQVAGSQIRSVMADLREMGAIDENAPDGSDVKAERLRGIKIPKWFSISTITQMTQSHRTLGHMAAGNLITTVRLLDAFKLCTMSGDFLVPLIVLRSLLEHIAVFYSVSLVIDKAMVVVESEPVQRRVMKIGEEITKRAYGTRIDWNSANFSPADAALVSKAIKYKPKTGIIDRTSLQILKALDELDKAVEGTRSVYEILCEFAHPNLGAMVISTELRGPKADEQGVLWTEHIMRSGPPLTFVHATDQLVPRILKQTAACLEHYLEVRGAVQQASQKLFALGQLIVRDFVAENSTQFEPYSTCPCGSGKKLKFCCGRR